jgi:hypothetical protein
MLDQGRRACLLMESCLRMNMLYYYILLQPLKLERICNELVFYIGKPIWSCNGGEFKELNGNRKMCLG